MTDEQIAKIADIRAISGLPEAYRAAFRLGVEQERKRCGQLCHEKYMELAHGKNHADPLDDYEYTLQSDIVKELRDEIMQRAPER